MKGNTASDLGEGQRTGNRNYSPSTLDDQHPPRTLARVNRLQSFQRSIVTDAKRRQFTGLLTRRDQVAAVRADIERPRHRFGRRVTNRLHSTGVAVDRKGGDRIVATVGEVGTVCSVFSVPLPESN